VVSLTATLGGQGDIALGNVVGSNIFNIAVILGITAALVPLRVQLQLLKLDAPFMVAVSGLFLWFFWDRAISQLEAGVLFALLVGYVGINVWLAKRQVTPAVDREFTEEMKDVEAVPLLPYWRITLLLVFGLGVLVAGSKAFVSGAVEIARMYQVSEAIIGLTIVAAGTSLPELASSLVAAFRKQADVAIGNIIGSNIFNILCILGLSGLAAGPLAGPGITQVDLYVMMAFSVVLIPMLWTGYIIQRWEGGVLLVGYGFYLAHIWPK
jgi:cation:H+ antiporter